MVEQRPNRALHGRGILARVDQDQPVALFLEHGLGAGRDRRVERVRDRRDDQADRMRAARAQRARDGRGAEVELLGGAQHRGAGLVGELADAVERTGRGRGRDVGAASDVAQPDALCASGRARARAGCSIHRGRWPAWSPWSARSPVRPVSVVRQVSVVLRVSMIRPVSARPCGPPGPPGPREHATAHSRPRVRPPHAHPSRVEIGCAIDFGLSGARFSLRARTDVKTCAIGRRQHLCVEGIGVSGTPPVPEKTIPRDRPGPGGYEPGISAWTLAASSSVRRASAAVAPWLGSPVLTHRAKSSAWARSAACHVLPSPQRISTRA